MVSHNAPSLVSTCVNSPFANHAAYPGIYEGKVIVNISGQDKGATKMGCVRQDSPTHLQSNKTLNTCIRHKM